MKRFSISIGLTIVTVIFCSLIASGQPAVACTGIRVKPQDGSVIVARTLEFASNLQSNIVVMPRGIKFVGTAPGYKAGLRWKSRYGIVGANMFNLPVIVDGLNEKGLAAAIFYFPDFAKYQEVKEDDVEQTIAPWELPLYLLGNCADVDEAIKAVREIKVGSVFLKNLDEVPPCHYLVSDANGRCVVLEYVSGGLKIHDNPLGVMTNAPTFDWHLTNLSNYINLTADNVPPKDVEGLTLRSLGQGSGMLGLPGDFTPPSRFVRAVEFSRSALVVATARDGVLQAFHILNQFDIPKGSARSVEDGKIVADYTQWTSAADLKNRRYYFRTFANSRIRMVDLHEMNLDAKTIKTISMSGEEVIEDLSKQTKH